MGRNGFRAGHGHLGPKRTCREGCGEKRLVDSYIQALSRCLAAIAAIDQLRRNPAKRRINLRMAIICAPPLNSEANYADSSGYQR